MGGLSRSVILIKGAGDLGTGVAVRLHRAGFSLVMTELPAPLVVRRTVAFAEAIPQGAQTVEGIAGIRVDEAAQCGDVLSAGHIPVLVDPTAQRLAALQPAVVIDAIMAKRNMGTRITDAPVVIALGPGFTAGHDCHAVIETRRGHTLGRVIYEGCAAPDTGMPGEIGGVAAERLLRAPACGVFYSRVALGDQVERLQIVGTIEPGGEPVLAEVGGLLRGLLRDGLPVQAGTKLGDVDPTCECARLNLVSDKALAVGGGVLEAILRFSQQ